MYNLRKRRKIKPEIPMSYPKIRPPIAAIIQANITKFVSFPWYCSPSFAATATPPAIVSLFLFSSEHENLEEELRGVKEAEEIHVKIYFPRLKRK